MNVAAMAVITFLIFAEKSLAFGQQIAKIAAIVLVVYGALVIFVPSMLPTMI
jgi:predicted metal-binding membrane protein